MIDIKLLDLKTFFETHRAEVKGMMPKENNEDEVQKQYKEEEIEEGREEGRADSKTMVIGEAIDQAIDSVPDDFVLKSFFETNREEVKDMMLMEYNEDEILRQFKQEGFEEGYEKGYKEGYKEGYKGGLERDEELFQRSMAWRMSSVGYRVAMIANLLDLPDDKVKEFVQAKPTM